MNTKTNTRWMLQAIVIVTLAIFAAGTAQAAFPGDCADRDTYIYFPRVPVGSPWCPEETGRMAALAGENAKTLERGFISILISVPGGEDDFEIGIFDGDTGEKDGSGVPGFDTHWDLGTTELGYMLFFDPDQTGNTDSADEITMVLGNAFGNPTSNPPENWTASADYLPDNDWWNFECPSGCTLLDSRAEGPNGNYHFHLLILYDADPGSPDNKSTISDFKLRGRTSTTPIAFATTEFAFEAALHNGADFKTVYPGWDGTNPPGNTFWLDAIAAGETTYDGEWIFFANLPELASLDLFDGDFDYGNLGSTGPDGELQDPSGLDPANPIYLQPCPLGPDTDDTDSFSSPNVEDPPVSWDFPDFVTLKDPSDPEYPVGEDDSLPQEAILEGGTPTDNVQYDPSRRNPCVTYRVIDPTGRVFDNLNPSSQREWEQFRICSQSAVPFGADECDYIVPDTLLPAGTWTAEILGMDMSNLNTWHLDVEEVANACLIGVDKTATPDTITTGDPDGCENLGKPDELVFRYTGEDCDPSGNTQGDKTDCSGDPAGAAPVEIFVTRDAGDVNVTPAGETIGLGDLVTFTATGNELKSRTVFDIRQGGLTLQALDIHTSCSAPLNVGDRFGAMTLVSFDGQTGSGGSNDVTYTYVVTNFGDPLRNVSLEDNKLGTIASNVTLGPGESQTFQETTQIFQTTTNIVTATGETAFGNVCTAEDLAIVTVDGGGGGECDVEGVTSLKFKGKDVKWKLENVGADTVTIESIEVSWPDGNAMLKEIHLHKKIFDTDVPPPSASITSFIGKLKERQLEPGAKKDLKFKFQGNADKNGAYSIIVNFAEGCSVEFSGGGGGGGEFSCAKPLDALTMIWDGTEPVVSVQAWKDVPGEVDLGYYTGINIGDALTVSGYAPKDGNDVIWEVFDAAGDKIGESTYHMSCSDDDMDGPEDCGKREGDGKGTNGGFINDWILEGMVDAVGTLECPNTP